MEITEPVDLALRGRLNPAAVGWTRRPLHRTNLPSRGRTKRWEYWGIVTDRLVLGLTIADLDYAHLTQIYAYDRERGSEFSVETTRPGPMRPRLEDGLEPQTAHAGALRFVEDTDRTTITIDHPRLRASFEARAGGESLGVVVPWSERRFQYTLKDLARPLTGTASIDGEDMPVEGGWAVLDRGRGIWPYRKTWNWAAGSGLVGGTRLGLQLGGKWTVGTPQTENALFVDGRLHRWPDEVDWSYDLSSARSPWRVRGAQVDAVLTPFHRRRAVTDVGLIASRTHQAFGTWSGTATDSDGREHRLDGLVGWAEEARNRW